MIERRSLVWRVVTLASLGLAAAALAITWLLSQQALGELGEYDRELLAAADALASLLPQAEGGSSSAARTAAEMERFLDAYEADRPTRQRVRFRVVPAEGREGPRLSWAELEGKTQRVATRTAGRWRVQALSSRAELEGRQLGVVLQDVALYMTLTAGVVVPVLALNVAIGLRPLRRLARTLDSRAAGDLAPLPLDARHAEIETVILTLNTHFERSERANRREREFVHDLAHDLRTPLAVLTAQTQVLLDAAGTGDLKAQAAAKMRIEHSASRVARIAEQLLRLSLLEHGEPLAAHDSAPWDLVGLVQDALADLSSRAEAADVEISLSAPPQLLRRVATMPFVAMLDNLLDNALRHGGAGRRLEVRLTGEAADPAASWSLSVRAHGPGLPVADRSLLFERFVRGHADDQAAEGTGLGLCIVTKSCERLGAMLSWRSTPEIEGCKFLVSWPGTVHPVAARRR